MLSHLKTQHQAEKRVLIQEAVMLRHVVKMIAKQCKVLKVSCFHIHTCQKEKQLADMKAQSQKKIAELNKRLKNDNEELRQ